MLADRIVRSVLDLVTAAVQAVALPAFSRMQGNRKKLRNAFYEAVRFTSLISFPTFLGLSSVAVLVFALFLGDKWAPSVPVLQVLCVLGVLDSVNRYTHSVTLACGKANWALYISIASALAIYLGLFVSVEWGIIAVAVARVAVGYLIAPVQVGAAHRLVGITYRDYFKQFYASLLASVAMVSVVLLAKRVLFDDAEPFLELIALILIGATVYVTSIHLIDRSILKDVRELFVGLRGGSAGRKDEETR